MPITRVSMLAGLLVASATLPTSVPASRDADTRAYLVQLDVEVHPKDNRKLTVFTRPGYDAPVPKT